jgi:hypothetical protein
MNVELRLPAAIEQLLLRRATASGLDMAALVEQLLTDAVIEDSDRSDESPTPARAQRFREQMEAWTQLHPVRALPIDDSRDSIYSGCGE